MGSIPSITVNTAPPCEHFGGPGDALVYRSPPRIEGDLVWACPCCRAVAYAAPGEGLGPCPTCDVDPVQIDTDACIPGLPCDVDHRCAARL